jgi:hypothetical protein
VEGRKNNEPSLDAFILIERRYVSAPIASQFIPLVYYLFNRSFGIKEAGYANHQYECGHDHEKIAQHVELVEHVNFENG